MSLEATADQLQTALEALAPKGCTCMVSVIGEELGELSSEEFSLTGGWAPHRLREFATGRQCARDALRVLEIVPGSLLPDTDGLPRWPVRAVGSISHSRGVAMAVVGAEAAVSLLGLDLEKTNRLSEAAIRKVVHPLEASWMAGNQVNASILFSLKEAFYKSQFPRWRTAGNFQDLALCVDLDAGVAQILEMDAHFAPELRRLRFAFRRVDDYVVSLCWL